MEGTREKKLLRPFPELQRAKRKPVIQLNDEVSNSKSHTGALPKMNDSRGEGGGEGDIGPQAAKGGIRLHLSRYWFFMQ